MATDYQIKFLKHGWGLSNGTPLVEAASTANPYAICFDTTTKQIYVGGVAYGGAISDANYANGVLTITKSNGTTQTLDFNDVASAEATLKVFAHMNELMGVTTVGSNTQLNYSGTNYLGTGINTLVAADKALDTQIKGVNDAIDAMDATNVRTVTDTTTGDVISLTINGINEANGVISANNTLSTVTFATVAKTGKAEDVSVATDAFTANNVEDALIELKDAITDANITIDGYKGAIKSDTNTMVPVAADGGKIGVKTDNVYIGSGSNGVTLLHVDTDASSTTGSDLATVNTVTAHISTAIDALEAAEIELATIAANAITIKGIKEEDGIISASGTTTIPVDGTVSSNNPLVTKNSISSAIEDLDVTGYVQGTVTGSTITVYGIKEEDGKIGSDTTNNLTIELDGNYDASTNKVALESTVTNAIEGLDVGTIQPVEYTAASGNNGAKLTFHDIAEQDGKIMLGTTGGAELQFAKVATSGEAVDVTLAAADTPYVGSNVDETIVNVDSRLKALETLPTFDTVVSTNAATTPSGVTWDDVTGTLVASNDTMHKIYLVPASRSGQSVNTYAEYITVKNGNAYTWEKVGDTSTDLTGYVRTITVNGKEYAVTTNTTDVALGNVVTSVVDGDNNLPTTGGYTSDYIQTKVTASTLSTAADGTRETTVTSAGAVKVQAVADADSTHMGLAEASDVKAYVGTQINNLTFGTETTGTNVQVDYSETNGIVAIEVTEKYATVDSSLNVTNPTQLVKGSDIETVKTYIGSRVQELDLTEQSVTGTNVSFKYKETDGIVEIGTLVVDYATVTGGTADNPSITVDNGTGLVTGNDISTLKTYVDNKISTVVAGLDADVTSDDAAVATVEVVEANGVITNVVVTNINAGVTYTAAGEGTDANLTFSTATGAVTGNDITAIKNYIDAKATEASTVTSANATMTVNDSNLTTLGTVAGTPIQAKTQLVWETYD